MYQATLKRILERMRKGGRWVPPPCPPLSLARLKSQSIERLGCPIPEAYAEFLAGQDGLDWNGLVVYASERTTDAGGRGLFLEGLIEGNLDYRDFEPMRDYLVFAEDGTVCFTYCVSAAEYRVITTVGLTVLEAYCTFEELLADALEGHV